MYSGIVHKRILWHNACTVCPVFCVYIIYVGVYIATGLGLGFSIELLIACKKVFIFYLAIIMYHRIHACACLLQHVTAIFILPYSGKFSRVLNFAVFADQGESVKFYTSKIFHCTV